MNKPSNKIINFAEILSEYVDSFILELKTIEKDIVHPEESFHNDD